MPQQVVVDQLIMNMHGNVAEYVLLSIPKWELKDESALYNVMSRLDNLLLGDYTKLVANAIQNLNACKHGGRSREEYILDHQLLLEKVMSPGKAVDSEYAGTMLLENSGITVMEQQLILATTGGSLDFFKVANVLRQLCGRNHVSGKKAAMISEEPLGMDTQEGFMSQGINNRTRKTVPKQGFLRQSRLAPFKCYNCHEKGHITNECKNGPVSVCTDGKPECKNYASRKSSSSGRLSISLSPGGEGAMMINESEDFTSTLEELTFCATEQQDQDYLQSISRILDTACT